jgi:hypothetical protein
LRRRYEEGWIQFWGCPDEVFFDPGGGNLSDEMLEAFSWHGLGAGHPHRRHLPWNASQSNPIVRGPDAQAEGLDRCPAPPQGSEPLGRERQFRNWQREEGREEGRVVVAAAVEVVLV